MSGPSDKAVEAAIRRYDPDVDGSFTTIDNGLWADTVPSAARAVLDAAHDPALGLDRSVCLRDVVDWLHGYADEYRSPQALWFASAIAQEFVGDRQPR